MTKRDDVANAVSYFPNSIDSDDNLYLVRDSLRVKLVKSYTPGDTSITIYDENGVISLFPPTGVITLTDQCNDIQNRGICFYYASVSSTGFSGLILLPGFNDVVKQANITDVTLNVVDYHHEVLKNTLMQIQHYVGLDTDANAIQNPNSTLMARLAYLKSMVLSPKAWFSADKTFGIASPTFTVTFANQSLKTGDTPTYTWQIYNHLTGNPVTIGTVDSSGNLVQGFTYGIYDISLTVENEYGSNKVTFEKMITARIGAPNEVVLEFIYGADQIATTITETVNGNPVTYAGIRAPTDSFINVHIIPDTLPLPLTGYDNKGEELSGGVPIDPIEQYTWSLGDDITHPSQPHAQALYSLGGVYSLILRTDTLFGAYRITKHAGVIDMVEPVNLWIWTFNNYLYPDTGNTPGYMPLDYIAPGGDIYANEFGLLSETFKTATSPLTVIRDESFINSTTQNGDVNVPKAKAEFRRNVSLALKGNLSSGHGGKALMYWAGQDITAHGQGTTYADNAVRIREHDGFTDSYVNHNSISRPWNWVCLNSDTTSYFILGVDYFCGSDPTQSPTYQVKDALNLSSLTVTSTPITFENYANGATELQFNPANYDLTGNVISGNYSVCRSAWRGSSGYFLRNSAVGQFFRIKSFYRTEGTLAHEFQTISKLTDMPGPTKLEGQLVPLSNGLFFFNNSGNISAYNDTNGTWETGGASASSSTFRSMQDTTQANFDDPTNTLLAASYDRSAYLSYDYSSAAFIKFNSLDLSFYNLNSRPVQRSQFLMGIY